MWDAQSLPDRDALSITSPGWYPSHLPEAVVASGVSLPHPALPQDAYSKRFIPVSSISRVAGIGDQKFEVITNNRNFVFRAESDGERRGSLLVDGPGYSPSPGPRGEPWRLLALG